MNPACAAALEIVQWHRYAIERVAVALLKYKTLNAAQVERCIRP